MILTRECTRQRREESTTCGKTNVLAVHVRRAEVDVMCLSPPAAMLYIIHAEIGLIIVSYLSAAFTRPTRPTRPHETTPACSRLEGSSRLVSSAPLTSLYVTNPWSLLREFQIYTNYVLVTKFTTTEYANRVVNVPHCLSSQASSTIPE